MPSDTVSVSDRLAWRLSRFVTTRPWVVIAAALILSLAASSGARFLAFSNNYRVFFSPDNPELVAFEECQNTYTKNDNLLFVLQPAEGEIFEPEMLDALEWLTAEAWQIPYAIRVDSVTNFQHSWADGDDLTVEDLVLDGLSLGTDEEVPAAVGHARDLKRRLNTRNPDVRVAVSGVSMLNNAFAETGQTDAVTLLPGMFVVLVVFMVVVLRSLTGSAGTLVVVALSATTALGLAGYAGVQLDPVSLTAPIIILTLGIADSVLVTVLSLMRLGTSKIDAIQESLRINLQPIVITSLTTVIGFLSLNLSDAPPFWYLGNITAVGIVAALLYSVLFLPAFLSVVPLTVKRRPMGGTRAVRTIGSLADWVTARHRPVLAVVGTFTVVLVSFVPTIDLNDEWVKYFDHRIPFRGDAEWGMANLNGIYVLEFSVDADGPEGISDPEYLRHLERFTSWLREQPEVTHVYSYSDVIKRLNQNMHADEPGWYQIPEERELAAQYLLLYELSLPFGLDLNNRISIDKSATRVTASVGDRSTVEFRGVLVRAEEWLEQETPDYMRSTPTGASVMFAYISERNITSMLRGNVMAVLLIAGVMIIALRSVGLGALSLIPNVVPILVSFGIWAVFFDR